MSEEIRLLVWRSLIAAESRAVYFGRIASAIHTRERVAAFVVGLASSVVFLNLVSKFSVAGVSEGLSLVSAVAGIYIGTAKQNKTAAVASSLCKTWGQVQDDFELLWHEMPALDATTTLERWRAIEKSHYEADESASALRQNKKLMRHAQEHVMTMRGLNAHQGSSGTRHVEER